MSDNSWYEKGELPPVGSEVIYKGDDTLGRNKDFEGKVVICLAHFNVDKLPAFAFSCGMYGIGAAIYSNQWFEPIKTERELAIEEMAKVMSRGTVGTYMSVAEKLYDAGYRKNES